MPCPKDPHWGDHDPGNQQSRVIENEDYKIYTEEVRRIAKYVTNFASHTMVHPPALPK
jgi:hypothetical protein